MNLSALLVTMIVSFAVPAIVALLTKSAASAWIKQFVTALLAAVTGVVAISTQTDGTANISKESIILALGTFALAQATYVGLYKPHGINAKLAPGAGIGPDQPANA